MYSHWCLPLGALVSVVPVLQALARRALCLSRFLAAPSLAVILLLVLPQLFFKIHSVGMCANRGLSQSWGSPHRSVVDFVGSGCLFPFVFACDQEQEVIEIAVAYKSVQFGAIVSFRS